MPPGEAHRPGDGGIEGRVDPVLPVNTSLLRGQSRRAASSVTRTVGRGGGANGGAGSNSAARVRTGDGYCVGT